MKIHFDSGPARTQQRGPITDTWDGRGGPATCECVHGKTWPEGDRFEGEGGRACKVCVYEWLAAERAAEAM